MFVGSETLQLGVYDAVAHFNIGCQAAVNVLTNLGMEPGNSVLSNQKKLTDFEFRMLTRRPRTR